MGFGFITGRKNMTDARRKQIEEAAKAQLMKAIVGHNGESIFELMFMAGADWADQNPAESQSGTDEDLAERASKLINDLIDAIKSERTRARDFEEVLEDHRRLVRELDVILSGADGAAKQASLCDLIGPAKKMVDRVRELEALLGRAKMFAESEVAMVGGTKDRFLADIEKAGVK